MSWLDMLGGVGGAGGAGAGIGAGTFIDTPAPTMGPLIGAQPQMQPQPQQGFWGGAMDKIGGAGRKLLSSEALRGENLPITLGQIGQAIAPQGSWQQALGGVGVGMGKSGKMATAQEKIDKQNEAYRQAISSLGAGMTPGGMRGGNKFSMDNKGGFTLSGDYGTQGAQTPMGEGVRQPEEVVPNFNVSSGRLTAGDLWGLSPQEISGLVGQQSAGDVQKLNMLKTIQALSPQAISETPRAGVIREGADGQYLVNTITGESTKLGIGVKPSAGKMGKIIRTKDKTYMVDAEGKKTDLGIVPFREKGIEDKAWKAPTTIKGWDKDGNPISKSVAKEDYNAEVAKIEKAGGRVGEAPGQVRENERLAINAEMTIADPEADKDARRIAGGVFNKTAPTDSDYIYLPGGFFGSGVKKTKLPMLGKKRMNMGYLRDVMKKFNLNNETDALEFFKSKQ